MSDKQKKKPVMGYDPLAWLKATDEPVPEQKQSTVLAEPSSQTEASDTEQQPMRQDQTAMTEHDSNTPADEQANQISSRTILLESRANIAQVEQLQKEMNEVLREHQHIKIDARDIEVVDTAILQLLVCFVREIKNVSGTVEWIGVSSAFCESAKLLDLYNKLDIAA